MTRGIEMAIAELKRTPGEPVVAEIEGLIVELRYRGRRTADDVFEEVGPWEGESAAELRRILHEGRVDSMKEPPAF